MTAAAAVDAYSERQLLMGSATQPPYEELEKRALRIYSDKTRLFVFWRSGGGVDCHAVGPNTRCFCEHSYSSHAWYETTSKQVRCRVAGCRCTCFSYVPGRGGSHIRCGCKHTHHEHRTADGRSGPCTKCGPGGCVKFHSDWRCSCGETYDAHTTVFETAAERARDGRPTEQNLGGWGQEKPHLDAVCGGLTSMTSMLSGVERLVSDLGHLELGGGGASTGDAVERGGGGPSGGGIMRDQATLFRDFDRRAEAHVNKLRQVRDGPARGAGKSAAAPLGFGAGRGHVLDERTQAPLRPGGPPPRPQRAPSLQQRREIFAAAAEQRASAATSASPPALQCECCACEEDEGGGGSGGAVATPPVSSQRSSTSQRGARPSSAAAAKPSASRAWKPGAAAAVPRPGSPRPTGTSVGGGAKAAGSHPAGNARAKAALSGGSSGAKPAKPTTPRAGARGPPSAAVLAARRLRAAEAAEARAAQAGHGAGGPAI